MDYRYIDTHAHVNINAFAEDREEVILRTREAGVAHINIGTQYDTSVKAVELAEQHEDGVYAVSGIFLRGAHPSGAYQCVVPR